MPVAIGVGKGKNSMTYLNDFFKGFGFVFIGIRLILSDKKLFFWSAVPFIINIILLVYGLSFGKQWVDQGVSLVLGNVFSDTENWWYKIAYLPLYWIVWFAFVVMMIYLAYIFAAVIASPFNSMVAEITLLKEGKLKGQVRGVAAVIKLSLKMFAVSLLKSVVLIGVGLVLFLLSFVPILNLLAAYCVFLILASDAMDYSWEVQAMNIRERWEYFKKGWLVFSGMAFFLSLTILIPGLTLLVLPATVVGAASLYNTNYIK